jgi:hypothetical protein
LLVYLRFFKKKKILVIITFSSASSRAGNICDKVPESTVHTRS